MSLLSLDRFKRLWAPIAQLAAWLVALVIVFMIPPPRLPVDSDQGHFTLLAMFITTVLLIIAFAYLRRGAPRAWTATTMAASTGIALLIGLILLFAYTSRLNAWTCEYDGNGAMVVGATYLPAAKTSIEANPPASCTRLIQEYAGATDSIWQADEIKRRHLFLGFFFAAVATVLAMVIFLAIQTIERFAKR